MVTKNIKKILLNKDGNKFVVDTENIVRSVNGVNADEQGNVQLGNLVKSVNGVEASENGNVTIPLPFVKTVNNTAPDSNGNVVLDLSSSGGIVGFPNLSAGVGIGNFNGDYFNSTKTYTLPSSGWVIGNIIRSNLDNGTAYIYINGKLIHACDTESPEFILSIALKSGTQIKTSVQGAVTIHSSLGFYPFLS